MVAMGVTAPPNEEFMSEVSDVEEIMEDEVSKNNNAVVSASAETVVELVHKGNLQNKEKEEWIGEAMSRVEDMFNRSGILETASLIKQHFGQQNQNKEKGKNITHVNNFNMSNLEQADRIVDSQSEVTIYRNAIIDQTEAPPSKRFSSSSEEEDVLGNVNTQENEGMTNVNLRELNQGQRTIIDNFISANRPSPMEQLEQHKRKNEQVLASRNKFVEDGQRPTTSSFGNGNMATVMVNNRESTQRQSPEEDRMDQIIRDAENSKAKIFQTPGNRNYNFDFEKKFVHSSMVDEEYMILAGHVDANIRVKIESGEYVDLAKLLPRDRVVSEDDQRLQMFVRNGQTFWMPMNDNVSISNFLKWEQAFRVYSRCVLKSTS